MVATFPEHREAKRQALLDTVESLRDVLAAGSDEAERLGTLPQATVDAIYESGLFAYKTARKLGGAEADAMNADKDHPLHDPGHFKHLAAVDHLQTLLNAIDATPAEQRDEQGIQTTADLESCIPKFSD